MTILIEDKLYPEKQALLDKIKNGKKLKDDDHELLYVYREVFFPITEVSGRVRSYGSLICVAALLQHEAAVDHLLKPKLINSDAYELGVMTKPLNVVLQAFKAAQSKGIKAGYERIIKKFLDKNIYLEGDALSNQSALHIIAIAGDQYPTLRDDIIKKSTPFTRDFFGTTPLMLSLQENQPDTAFILLELIEKNGTTSDLVLPRNNGASAIHLACEYIGDPNKGINIFEKMIAMGVEINDPFENRFFVLYNSLLSEHKACRIPYFKYFLEKGADPDLCGRNERLTSYCINAYNSSKNSDAQSLYLEAFKLLLKFKVDVFFTFHSAGMEFLHYIKKFNPELIDLILEAFKDDQDKLTEINYLLDNIPPIARQPDEQKAQDEFFAISMSLHGKKEDQDVLFDLKEKFKADWPSKGEELSDDLLARSRVWTVLIKLSELHQNGQLTTQSTLKYADLLKSFGKVFEQQLPFIYREYLIKIMQDIFSAGENKLSCLRDFLKISCELLNYVTLIEDAEISLTLQEDFNEIFKNFIRILSLEIKNIKLDDLMPLIETLKKDKILDKYSQAFIAQFEMAAAYHMAIQEKELQKFISHQCKFDEHFDTLIAGLTKDHLLQRQYWFWKISLIAKQLELAKTEPTQEQVYTFEKALITGRLHLLPIHLLTFEKQLSLYQNQKKEQLKQKKILEKQQRSIEVSPPIVVKQPIIEPVANPPTQRPLLIQAPAALSSSAGESSTHKLTKSEKSYVRYMQNALNDIEHNIQRLVVPNPEHTPEEVQALFKTVLRPDEVLKPLKYKTTYGVYYAVCRTDACARYDQLDQRFTHYFAAWNDPVRMGAPSGIVYEYGTFRLKLGHNDFRLHADIYKSENANCYLLIFNELWHHDAHDFKPSSKKINRI